MKKRDADSTLWLPQQQMIRAYYNSLQWKEKTIGHYFVSVRPGCPSK